MSEGESSSASDATKFEDADLAGLDDVERMLSAITILEQELEARNEELTRKNEELRIMSITDSLTRLCNRRHALERLMQEISRARRSDSPLALILMDIDHFKKINDTLGHQQGDAVLIRVAEIMTQSIRAHDLAARYGGEEFLVILPETDGEGAFITAEKIRGAIEQEEFPGMAGLRVTISLGLSNIDAKASFNLDDWIRLADEALYRAKSEGRNRTKRAAAPAA